MSPPRLSWACGHDLRAEERANTLLNTPGLYHVCTGWLMVNGVMVKCECACHAEQVKV